MKYQIENRTYRWKNDLVVVGKIYNKIFTYNFLNVIYFDWETLIIDGVFAL